MSPRIWSRAIFPWHIPISNRATLLQNANDVVSSRSIVNIENVYLILSLFLRRMSVWIIWLIFMIWLRAWIVFIISLFVFMNWTLLLLLYLIKVKTALSIDLICIYLIASIAPLAIEVIHRKVYLSIIIISSLTSATNILMIRHIIDIEICCVCILPLLIGMPFTQGLRLLSLSLRRWHGKRAVHSHLVLCTRITRIENATIVMLRFYLWGRGRGPSEIVFFVFSDLFVLIIIRIKMLWCLFLYILIDVIIFNIFEIWIYVSAIILRCAGRRWHVLFDLIVDEFNINLLIMTVPFLWR